MAKLVTKKSTTKPKAKKVKVEPKVEKPKAEEIVKPKAEEPKVEKPEVKKPEPKADKPKVENINYKEVVEIDASKPKTLNIEKVEFNGKMLLKCFGDSDLQLGKETDGNVIHCKGETHAVLEFFEVWQLMSICKL